jgi:DNA-binding SARP family transcriptional activator
MVDRIIESFRDESWEVDTEDPGVETDPVVEEETEPGVARDRRTETTGAGPALATVRVLGPVEVIGWRVSPDRAVVTELACYLALHADVPVSGDSLRSALWPEDAREASAKSLRTYISLLRKALGSDRVPSGSASGYRLSAGVRVDWVQFQQLTGPEASADDLTSALRLIRGRPFAAVPPHSFHWVYAELLLSEMEVAIVRAARQLAVVMTDFDRFDLAAWAIGQGLLAVPSDIGLWELQLSVARRRGPDDLRRACRDAEAVLGADAAELIQAATA